MADVAYKIVSHAEFQDTEDEVDALLKQGWYLHGELKVISGAPNLYAQAMVQREFYGGSDYSLFVTLEELDTIRYGLDSIGEAVETLAKAVGYAALGTTAEPPKPPRAKPAKAKRKPSPISSLTKRRHALKPAASD